MKCDAVSTQVTISEDKAATPAPSVSNGRIQEEDEETAEQQPEPVPEPVPEEAPRKVSSEKAVANGETASSDQAHHLTEETKT